MSTSLCSCLSHGSCTITRRLRVGINGDTVVATETSSVDEAVVDLGSGTTSLHSAILIKKFDAWTISVSYGADSSQG